MFKILIIEDEQDIRVLMKTHLSSKGYEVIEARNGLDGMSTLFSTVFIRSGSCTPLVSYNLMNHVS